jgi:hypothetical protein
LHVGQSPEEVTFCRCPQHIRRHLRDRRSFQRRQASLGLARGAGEAETWTGMAWRWLRDLAWHAGAAPKCAPRRA